MDALGPLFFVQMILDDLKDLADGISIPVHFVK